MHLQEKKLLLLHPRHRGLGRNIIYSRQIDPRGVLLLFGFAVTSHLHVCVVLLLFFFLVVVLLLLLLFAVVYTVALVPKAIGCFTPDGLI